MTAPSAHHRTVRRLLRKYMVIRLVMELAPDLHSKFHGYWGPGGEYFPIKFEHWITAHLMPYIPYASYKERHTP
jgi:hypothetical protein